MTELPQTRQSLLLRLAQQSDRAWDEFLEVYEGALYRYCRANRLQDADAADVTQEVLAALWKRIPDWDPDRAKGSFRAWLFRVARNVSVDLVTARAQKAVGSGDANVDQMLAEWPQSEAAQREALETEYRRSLFHWAARRVKSQVQPITWQSFQRTAVEGRKSDDVARELGVSVGTVYTAKCRVVARIRKMVAELDDEFEPSESELTG
ncbi:MAG: sigma-70 family RNA polymerase sigma factor [Planctomycetota bacterium]